MSADHLPLFPCLSDPLTSEIDTSHFLSDTRSSGYDSLSLPPLNPFPSNLFLREDSDLPYLSPGSPGEFNDSSSVSSSCHVSDQDQTDLSARSHTGVSPLAPSAVTAPLTDMEEDPRAYSLTGSILIPPMPAAPTVGSPALNPMLLHGAAQMSGLPTAQSLLATQMPSLPGAVPHCLPGVAPPVTHHKKHELKISTSKPIAAKVEHPSPSSSPSSSSLSSAHSLVPPLNGHTAPVPPASVSVDTETIRELLKEQSVKKQRLARKAELARVSRKRKKTRLCDLEGEVAKLKEELERERKQRKMAQENLAVAQQQARISQAAVAASQESSSGLSETVFTEDSKMLIDAIRRAMSVSSAAPPGPDSVSEVQKLVTDAVNLLKKRHGGAPAQLHSLVQLLTPSLQMRFLEWALTQKDGFYADSSGLWNSLFVREVGLSAEQLTGVMAIRVAMQQQRAASQAVQAACAQLQSAVQTQSALAASNLDRFVAMFTPEQLAKFFAWVDTYGSVCVQINV